MPHILFAALIGAIACAAYRACLWEMRRVGRLLAGIAREREQGETLVSGADGIYRPKRG